MLTVTIFVDLMTLHLLKSVDGALPKVMTKILLPYVNVMEEYKPELVKVHRVGVYLLGGFSSRS